MESVRVAVIDEAMELLPPGMLEAARARRRALLEAALAEARVALDEAEDEEDPLVWWPRQRDASSLFAVTKMLFAIPASTADDERAFSSAGFILNQRRTRLEMDNFRREHRIRQYVASGTTLDTQEGKAVRLERASCLLGQLAPAQPPADDA